MSVSRPSCLAGPRPACRPLVRRVHVARRGNRGARQRSRHARLDPAVQRQGPRRLDAEVRQTRARREPRRHVPRRERRARGPLRQVARRSTTSSATCSTRIPSRYYLLAAEYRFVGEQVKGGPAWARRNNGLMLHAPAPETMLKDQDFPISLEVQLLGGLGDGKPRTTANLCTPGTNVVMEGQARTEHCINSTSKTYDGDQWVRVEVARPRRRAGPAHHGRHGRARVHASRRSAAATLRPSTRRSRSMARRSPAGTSRSRPRRRRSTSGRSSC